jgi:hypothetical protein
VRPLDSQEASLAEVYRPLRRDQDPAAERERIVAGWANVMSPPRPYEGVDFTAMKELEVPKELQLVKGRK